MTAEPRARPVGQYLTCFAVLAQKAVEASPESELAQGFQPAPCRAEEPEALLEAAREEAREEGRAEGLAQAQAHWSARFAEQEGAFDAALASARAGWVCGEAEALKEKIARAYAEIEAELATSLARVVTPFVLEGLRSLMLDRLVEDIRLLLGGEEGPAVRISGPADLLGALRERLPAAGAGIDFAPAEAVDVEVLAGRTFIDSRLEAWMKRINATSE